MGEMIEIGENDKKVSAYLATPEDDPKGAIIVIHEVWGLVDHIKSVADRYAEKGYIALAPSLLDNSEFNSEELKEIQKKLFNPEEKNSIQTQLRKMMAPMQEPEFGQLTVGRLEECFNYLYDQPETKQKVAVTGFCFGGSYSFSLAITEPRLLASFVFYGHADQPVNELQSIKCPVRAFFGEQDERLITGLHDLKIRMNEAGVDFEAKVYSNCGHAFFNDSNPYAYNKEASEDAWEIVNKKLEELTS